MKHGDEVEAAIEAVLKHGEHAAVLEDLEVDGSVKAERAE